MKQGLLALVVMAVVSQTHVGVSHAAPVDIFLLVQGINGESTTQGRTNWNNVLTSSWGQGQAAPGTGAGAKVVFDSLAFTKFVDSTSPTFAFLAASGQSVPQAVLEFTRTLPGGQVVVITHVELIDVRVVQYKAGGSASGSTLPTETVGLSFSRIRWTVQRFGIDGRPFQGQPPVTAGWDLMRNQAL